jgi:hypothetical protein
LIFFKTPFFLKLSLSLVILCYVNACQNKQRSENAYYDLKKNTPHSTAPKETEQRTQEESPSSTQMEKKAPNSNEARQRNDDTGIINANLDSQKDRKFVRTADTRCQVKSVPKATRNLEELTTKYKGFMTNGHFQSQIVNEFTKPATLDSLLNVKIVRVIQDLTIRVPNMAFDSLLRDIQKLSDFVDYRIIRANDVQLQLLAKTMFIDRFKNYDNNYNKMYGSNTVYGQDHLLNNQTQNDQKHIDKLRLEDEVNYSTIQINLYQKEYAYQQMVINLDKIIYKPSIFVHIQEAFYDSLEFLQNILLFVIKTWFVWSVLIFGVFFWRKWKNND